MSTLHTLGVFLVCLLASGSAGETVAASDSLLRLTTIGAIRQLTAEEARRGYPVRVRGVVTLNNPYVSLMFVQDETGGIYVLPEHLPWSERQNLLRGTRLQIEGITGFGQFSPVVRGKEGEPVQMRILGQAPLPEPLRLSLDHLADPRYQNQWIEVSGVVRQVTTGVCLRARWRPWR